MAVLPNVRLAYDCIIKRWHVNISNAHSLHLHIIAAKKDCQNLNHQSLPMSFNAVASIYQSMSQPYKSMMSLIPLQTYATSHQAGPHQAVGHSSQGSWAPTRSQCIRIDATLFYLLQGVSTDSEAMRIMEWRFLAVFRAQEACPNSNVIHSGQSGRTWNGIHTRHLVIGRSTHMGVAKGHPLNQRGKEQMAAVSLSSPLLIEWGTRFNSHSLVASCRHTPMTRFSAHLLPFTLSLNLTVTTRRIGSGSDSRLHSIGLPPPLLHYLSQYHT